MVRLYQTATRNDKRQNVLLQRQENISLNEVKMTSYWDPFYVDENFIKLMKV